MKRFWEIESVEDARPLQGDEEKFCEEHFSRTHCRNKDGRYIVQMPMKEDSDTALGVSKEVAVRRLNSLWRRLNKDPNMKSLYTSFMEEYENLRHMKVVQEHTSKACYYLPHHGVYRPEKATTKLRVVFNASSPTSTGISLNDILLNGGTVQDDIFPIIPRFRSHKYVVTADIQKMHSHVRIDPLQRDYQRIPWKKDSDGPIKIFRLQTVTYGTTSASFLATRVLQQLAKDEEDAFPLASAVVSTDFSVGDILSGHSNLSTAKVIQQQLIQLLSRCGMTLHKWCSNNEQLCGAVSSEGMELPLDDAPNPSVKTLGMLWTPSSDTFSCKVTKRDENQSERSFTKRFFARRGRSAVMFSDNGTNSVGANAEFKRSHSVVNRPSEKLANYLEDEIIFWKFMPPGSPHFGGLWEAGVKSFRHHLKRTIGMSKLTFAEFNTLTSQIEGILNSRPRTPLSSDVADFEVLTPGHLIGRPINATVEPELSEVPENRLSRCQRTTKIVQAMWKRWQRDYFNNLPQRTKWFFRKDNVQRNALVLVKEDNLPPCKWSLGRIVYVVPGPDGNFRVVSLKTRNGILKRLITKIFVLPLGQVDL